MGNYFASLCGFRPPTWLKITGEDVFGFLQGQFTNDLKGPPGSATYGLWLNQKGKVLADSHVLRESENQFRVLSDYSSAATIVQRLEQYIIADDVVIEDQTDEVRGLVVRQNETGGELLAARLGALPDPGKFSQIDGGWIFRGRRSASENYEIIGSETVVAEWQKRLLAAGGTEVGPEEMELARISSGIPSVPQDIGPGDLPNEAGLEQEAISFTKGCYLGQEVMARLKNLGQVRRHLQRVRGEGPAPKMGTPLFQGEKKAGEIRSAVSSGEGFVALAMLTRLGLDEKAGFTFEPGTKSSYDAELWTS
ncbi:MAG TPA: folate-binding protein [Lacunisphaera sp.]